MLTRWFNKVRRRYRGFWVHSTLGCVIDILDLFCDPHDLVAFGAFQRHRTVFQP